MGDRFDELFERLRAAQFTAGPDHYLRMRQLLAVADVRPPRLKFCLAPIFSGSPEQQLRFYEIFDQVFGPDREEQRLPSAIAAPRFSRAERATLVICVSAAVGLLISVLITSRSSPGAEESPPATTETPAGYRRVEEWVNGRHRLWLCRRLRWFSAQH